MNKILVISALFGFMLFACDKADLPTISDATVETSDVSYIEEELTVETEATSLDSATISGLLYLREEEKLAHDVYVFLYDKWALKVFANIIISEQRHTEAVLNLLNTYGIPDIVNDNAEGVFVNEALQAMYNSLVERGSSSIIEALNVGVYIEEMDIVDLVEAMEPLTDTVIINVYTNLLNGSYNHLDAFVRNLNKTGI